MYSGGVALDSRWRKAARVDSDPPRRAGHALGLEIARHRPDARSRPKTRGDDPGGSGRARRGFALRARLAFPGAFRAARAAPRHRFLSSSALDGPSSAFARKAKIPVHVVPAPGKPRPKVPDILGWRRALEAWGDQAKPAKLDPRRHRHRTVSTANAISAQMVYGGFPFWPLSSRCFTLPCEERERTMPQRFSGGYGEIAPCAHRRGAIAAGLRRGVAKSTGGGKTCQNLQKGIGGSVGVVTPNHRPE
jgi:hypothetical protein